MHPWIKYIASLMVSVAAAGIAEAQQRVVAGSDVACRDQPRVSSPAVTRLNAGDRLTIADRRTVDEADWYLATNRMPTVPIPDMAGLRSHCWVYGPLTVELRPGDPEAALIAIADRILGRSDAAFEELVAIENLFAWEPFESAVVTSGRLQVRRLSIIDRAVVRMARYQGHVSLPQAWLIPRRELLARNPFGGSWYLRPDVYWELFAQYEGTEAAEDIAWAAVQAMIPRDECYTDCVLALLTETYMRYWTMFPEGRFVRDALARATDRSAHASRFCILSVMPGYEYIAERRSTALASELRQSVQGITVPEREALVAELEYIEQWCRLDALSGPDDPRALPVLVRALGIGFAVIRQALVEFGEEAVPALIEVATSAERRGDAGDALLVLRLIVEQSEGRPLSDDAMAGIRRTAGYWLAVDQQRWPTLRRAIDLAIATGDAELRRIVESLAANADEIAARGIEEPRDIERVQQDAAARLDGVPAMPRR